LDYIRDTCDYCTDYQLPNLQFALNHKGQPDIALFDFTSMYAAKNSIFVKERNGKQLLSFIVGDGLLEVRTIKNITDKSTLEYGTIFCLQPFWPTGTGAARGFLGVFDSCWALRNWNANKKSVYEIMAEREALYKLLPQTTPENLNKDFKKYSIFPGTRWVGAQLPKYNWNKFHLFDNFLTAF
jgi:hypothetical protein